MGLPALGKDQGPGAPRGRSPLRLALVAALALFLVVLGNQYGQDLYRLVMGGGATGQAPASIDLYERDGDMAVTVASPLEGGKIVAIDGKSYDFGEAYINAVERQLLAANTRSKVLGKIRENLERNGTDGDIECDSISYEPRMVNLKGQDFIAAYCHGVFTLRVRAGDGQEAKSQLLSSYFAFKGIHQDEFVETVCSLKSGEPPSLSDKCRAEIQERHGVSLDTATVRAMGPWAWRAD